jgi:hypothetical protein
MHHLSIDVEKGTLDAYTAALEAAGLRIVERGDYGGGDATAFISPRTAPGILVQFWQVPGFRGDPPDDHLTKRGSSQNAKKLRRKILSFEPSGAVDSSTLARMMPAPCAHPG